MINGRQNRPKRIETKTQWILFTPKQTRVKKYYKVPRIHLFILFYLFSSTTKEKHTQTQKWWIWESIKQMNLCVNVLLLLLLLHPVTQCCFFCQSKGVDYLRIHFSWVTRKKSFIIWWNSKSREIVTVFV